MKQTTISIDNDLHHTAQQKVAPKYRGGFSGYVESLIRADLKASKVEIIPAPEKAVREDNSNG